MNVLRAEHSKRNVCELCSRLNNARSEMSKQNTTTTNKSSKSSKKATAANTQLSEVKTTKAKAAVNVFNHRMSALRCVTIDDVLVRAAVTRETITMKQLVERVRAIDASINAISNHVRHLIDTDRVVHDAKTKTYSLSDDARKLAAAHSDYAKMFAKKSK